MMNNSLSLVLQVTISLSLSSQTCWPKRPSNTAEAGVQKAYSDAKLPDSPGWRQSVGGI